jgi:hypothetical protein
MTDRLPRTAPASPRRRLAEALVRRAATVMPREQHTWADAMRNEIAYVADDRDAFRWAIGCLRAAHVARLRALYLLDVAFVRFGGALLAAFLAFSGMFATALTLAYRLQALGTAEQLGGLTVGDDYRRLVPLMEGIPWWAHALAVAGGACYLVAIVYLLRRRTAAYVALLLGVGLSVGGEWLVQPIIAEIGVAAVPNPSFLAAWLLPIVCPLLLAFAAWSGSRARAATTAEKR